MSYDSSVVSYCPLKGHSPLCSNELCHRESLNGYINCMKELGLLREDEHEDKTKEE